MATKFLLKCLIFFAVIAAFIFVLVMPQYDTEYMAALGDKFALVRADTQPKILLVGGSNVAFGFDSALLEEKTQMRVVNFGVHAALGQPFHADIIKNQLNPGDIVILAPEYYDYTSDDCDYVLAWLSMERDAPLFLAAAKGGHLGGLLSAFPTYFQRAAGRFVDRLRGVAEPDERTRYEFDAHGDYAAPRPERIVEMGESSSFNSPLLSEYLRNYWNNFNEVAHKKGATVYMSCPPIVAEALSVELKPLQEQLEKDLGFPVISQLADYVYPFDFFYDTGFHLNDEGRIIRSLQLAEDLSTR